MPVPALRVVRPLDQRPSRRIAAVRRWQPDQRAVIDTLEMLALGFEPGTPLLLNQPRRCVGKGALGIAERLTPFGLEEQGPARAKPFEDVVRPGAGRYQFRFRRAFEIRAAKGEGPHEAAVLVEDDAGCDQRGPGQMVGEPVGARPIFR